MPIIAESPSRFRPMNAEDRFRVAAARMPSVGEAHPQSLSKGHAMSIRFVALESELVKSLQAGGLDANGQRPERHISEGGMMPCRHCLADIEPGEPYLIVAHRPFDTVQPYAEQGPIFLHAETCARRPDSPNVPAMFLERKDYLIRGYSADDRIVYGTGKIVAPTAMVEA